jgi:uncharacterized protein
MLRQATNLTIGFANRTSDSSGNPADWWREQSGDDAGCLCFDSDPLAAALDMMGEPLFNIRVRADKPIAKLYARVTEVTPDGRSHFVSYALLNLTHRDSHEHPSPLKPGKDYDVALKGKFACYRFAPGSRIRVALSETWWPVVWPSPELVALGVTSGVSRVTLPVRAAGSDQPPPFVELRDRYDVPGADRAPYLDRLGGVEVSGAPGHRTFTLVDGSATLDDETVVGTGTVYGQAYRLRRSICEDNPNSAEIESEAINSYVRGTWRIKLRSWALGRSTPTSFINDETFEAWEGDKLIVSRRWQKTIDRKLV